MSTRYNTAQFSPATQFVDPSTGRLTREGYNILQRVASSAVATDGDLSALETMALGRVPNVEPVEPLPAPAAVGEAPETIIVPASHYAELVQRIEELEGRLWAVGV